MIEVISGDECFTTLDKEGYILYYFTASWCGPCQQIWDNFVQLTQTYNNILFFKIDVSDEDNSEICEKCEVESVPSFLLFKDRNYISRVTGANLQKVQEMLNRI